MRSGPDRGAATLLVLAVAVVGFALALAAARTGGLLVVRARADTAADAAALAAADALALGRGSSEARDAAAATARLNGARLRACQCAGLDAEVVVEVSTALRPDPVTSRARAEVRPECAVPGASGCGPRG